MENLMMWASVTDSHGAAEKPPKRIAFGIVEAILRQTLLHLADDAQCFGLSSLSIPLNQHYLLARPDDELEIFVIV